MPDVEPHDRRERTDPPSWRPVPDPTLLTTQALYREVATLRELIEEKILATDQLVSEKFASVDRQLDLVERQRVEQKSDTKAAVDAALCVSADTPILCADLIWRTAGDLLPGDELIAFDEEAVSLRGRRYRRAVVTANSLMRDVLLQVNTTEGLLRCNYDHPLLVRSCRGHAWHWVKAQNIRPGNEILKILDVWEVDRSWEAGWLAGILDGEGCLTFRSHKDGIARLGIGQVAGTTADAIDAALKSRVGTIGRHTRPAQPYASGGYSGNAQAQRRWQVDRRADILQLLGSVRPKRLLEDSDQVWEGFLIRNKAPGRTAMVTSIESAGTGMVASLSTSTGTYIGGGLGCHNTAQKRSGP